MAVVEEVPDSGRRDAREMLVWDGTDEESAALEDLAMVFRFGHVSFKHPDVSGSVQISGPPPIVRLNFYGEKNFRIDAPVLAVTGAPREFGEIVEWLVASAVERYDLRERAADDLKAELREIGEASGFAITDPERCWTLPGRDGFPEKREQAAGGDKAALAFMRRYSTRTALLTVEAETPLGRMNVTVDGRELPVAIWSERYPDAARIACLALRLVGIDAQAWGNDLVKELFAVTTGLGELSDDAAGEALVDFSKGLADLPVEFEFTRDEREEFLRRFETTRNDYVTARREREAEKAEEERQRDEREERQREAVADEIRMRGGTAEDVARFRGSLG